MTSLRTIGVPRHALVIGGGFLGTHIARGFVRRGAETTLLTRRPLSGGAIGRTDGVSVVLGDADDEDVARILETADHVVWAAGGLMPAESNQRPMEDVVTTLLPLLRTLEALVARGDGAITLLSSGGTIYGNPSVLPVPEHMLPQPLSSHGVMKVASERYLALYREVFGVRALSLRCANVYGEGQLPHRSQGVVATALACVREGRPVPLFGDGRAVRDYVYVDDVVDVVCTLATREQVPEVVNVGTGVGTSVRTLLDLIGEITGREVETTPLPERPGDVRSVILDVSLLDSLMAFDPMALDEGITHTWGDSAQAQHFAGS